MTTAEDLPGEQSVCEVLAATDAGSAEIQIVGEILDSLAVRTSSDVQTFPNDFPSGRSHADAYDFIPEARRQQLDTAAAVAARLRGGSRPRSFLAEVVKVILGGVVGLAIGYWVLNYFGGARFDWLAVYLPGCSHTRDHWPAEYLPWESANPTTPSTPINSAEPINSVEPIEPIEPVEVDEVDRPRHVAEPFTPHLPNIIEPPDLKPDAAGEPRETSTDDARITDE